MKTDSEDECGTNIGHMIGPIWHYDVIDFVLVAKRRGRVA